MTRKKKQSLFNLQMNCMLERPICSADKFGKQDIAKCWLRLVEIYHNKIARNERLEISFCNGSCSWKINMIFTAQ